MLSFSPLPSSYCGFHAPERGSRRSIGLELQLDSDSITATMAVIADSATSTVFVHLASSDHLATIARAVARVIVIVIAVAGQGFGFDRF